MSALFVASQNDEAKVCQALLDGQADVNFQYLENQTPLIVATANEYTEVVKVLLKVIVLSLTVNSSVFLFTINTIFTLFHTLILYHSEPSCFFLMSSLMTNSLIVVAKVF